MKDKWKKTTLGEIMTLQRGYDLPIQNRNVGSVPIIASTGIAGYHNEAMIRGPWVVIGRSGSIGGGQFVENEKMKPPDSYTETDQTRCFVLNEFKTLCKSYRLNISLESTRGLQTHDPNNPVNIWLYRPQHEMDKAPIKIKRVSK